MDVLLLEALPLPAAAVRFDGFNGAEIAEWAGDAATYENFVLVIHTPQGDMTPEPGEWVMHDDLDDHYPVKQAVITRKYRPRSEEP